MCSIQMNFSYCALRGAVRALFFLSVLNVFSFSHFKFEVDAYCSINHRVQHGKVLKMAYSATELSNLKTITIKKLGSKLSEEYLLVTSTVKSSQSRSEVLDCIAQRDVTSGDINKKLKAKIVKEQERYDREYKNYQTVCGQQKVMTDFIAIERFEKNALAKIGAKISPSSKIISVIIMEAGAIDLKKASAALGPLRDGDLVRVAKSMASALAKIQGKGLVWTDLKTDNYVFVPTEVGDINRSDYFSTAFTCKAIDLESAVGVGKPIVDFSPEVATPEQVDLLTGGELSSQGGRATDYTIAIADPILARKESDIWALGISILHMYLGRAPISDKSEVNNCFNKIRSYEAGTSDLGLSEVTNSNLKKLLTNMLSVNPKKRPSIGMVQIALNFCS